MAGAASLFICSKCAEAFTEAVWHCPTRGCDHHWLMGRTYCGNCHGEMGSAPSAKTGRWVKASSFDDSSRWHQ